MSPRKKMTAAAFDDYRRFRYITMNTVSRRLLPSIDDAAMRR
jgi:hypothetical protein